MTVCRIKAEDWYHKWFMLINTSVKHLFPKISLRKVWIHLFSAAKVILESLKSVCPSVNQKPLWPQILGSSDLWYLISISGHHAHWSLCLSAIWTAFAISKPFQLIFVWIFKPVDILQSSLNKIITIIWLILTRKWWCGGGPSQETRMTKDTLMVEVSCLQTVELISGHQ